MSGTTGPERVRPISRPTVQPYQVQIADAEHNLTYGHEGRVTIPSHAVTGRVRKLQATEDGALYAVWADDHLRGAGVSRPVGVVSMAASERAAAEMAHTFLADYLETI